MTYASFDIKLKLNYYTDRVSRIEPLAEHSRGSIRVTRSVIVKIGIILISTLEKIF